MEWIEDLKKKNEVAATFTAQCCSARSPEASDVVFTFSGVNMKKNRASLSLNSTLITRWDFYTNICTFYSVHFQKRLVTLGLKWVALWLRYFRRGVKIKGVTCCR